MERYGAYQFTFSHITLLMFWHSRTDVPLYKKYDYEEILYEILFPRRDVCQCDGG